MRAWLRAVVAIVAASAVLPVVAVVPAFALPVGCSQVASTVTCTYSSTGEEQQFTVPAGVVSIEVTATGGKGSAGSQPNFSGVPGAGAFGALVSGSLSVTPGQVLYVEVGGNGQVTAGGWNGGGDGATQSGDASGGGGGASDVRSVSCSASCDPGDAPSLASRLVIAGGGGGGGAAFLSNGGAGGGSAATGNAGSDGVADPGDANSGGKGGGGGTSTLPGAAGAAGTGLNPAQPGTAGSSGQGGSGQVDEWTQEAGGGGGGGYYGGGGGGSGARTSSGSVGGGGGGGGGSSFTDPSMSNTSMSTDSTGTPSVTISYTLTFQPDGWIRKGSNPFSGNDIYNNTGSFQTKVMTPVVGARVLFRIAIQNDGNGADRFTIHATGAAAPDYRIRYYRRWNEITDAVVSGTFTTPTIAPGSRYIIEAWVKALPGAGPSASRLVTITSVHDNTKVDAVKFIVRPR